MNEAERGLAAYRASAKRAKGAPKKKSRDQTGDVTLDVAVGRGQPAGSAGGAAAGGTSSADRAQRPEPAQKKPGGAAGEAASAAPVRQERAGGSGGGQKTGSDAAKGAADVERLMRTGAGAGGYRKVAKFLLLLGKDDAAKVLKHFSVEEVETISREITQIRKIETNEAKHLLDEFGGRVRGSAQIKAGPDAARGILNAAFGETRARAILTRVLPESRDAPFRFLDDLDHEQILLLLKNESTPTVSIILPFLKPAKASKLLEALPGDIQKETIRRIAKIKRVSPEVVASIEAVLKERIRTQGKVVAEDIDGRSALANILKYMDRAHEETILEELSAADPELTDDLRDRMLSIDLIFKIDDAELQSVFRDYDDQELAVILKGKNEEITTHILSNISVRRQAIVKEEAQHLGKMRRSDVDKTTKDFVQYLLDLDEQRKITIHWNDQFVD